LIGAFWSAALKRRFLSFAGALEKKESGVETPHSKRVLQLASVFSVSAAKMSAWPKL
jgi:hypothetical protein